jgi:hypothetical protein
MVFNVKKLLNKVVDLMLRQRSKKSNANGMSGGSCGLRPPDGWYSLRATPTSTKSF